MSEEIVVTIPDDSTDDAVEEVVETLTELVETSLETIETVVEELTETIETVVEESEPKNDGYTVGEAAFSAALDILTSRITSLEDRITANEVVEEVQEISTEPELPIVVEPDVAPPTFKSKARKFWFGDK